MPPCGAAGTTRGTSDTQASSGVREQDIYLLAGRMAGWFGGMAAALSALALYIAFVVLPSNGYGDPYPSHEYGDHYRILLVHIPMAWVTVYIYLATAAAIVLDKFAAHRLFSAAARALAPTGAMFAFLTLWTGSMWGKPIWGVWWVWGMPLASMLLMLLVFLGFVAVQFAMDGARRADKIGGALILFGLAILSVLYLGVGESGRIHNSSTVQALPPALSDIMQTGVLVMTLGLAAYAVAATLTRLRVLILERERHSEWVTRMAGN